MFPDVWHCRLSWAQVVHAVVVCTFSCAYWKFIVGMWMLSHCCCFLLMVLVIVVVCAKGLVVYSVVGCPCKGACSGGHLPHIHNTTCNTITCTHYIYTHAVVKLLLWFVKVIQYLLGGTLLHCSTTLGVCKHTSDVCCLEALGRTLIGHIDCCYLASACAPPLG